MWISVRNPETLVTHLTQSGSNVSACGVYVFIPDPNHLNDNPDYATCMRCLKAQKRYRQCGIPEDDIANHVLYVTAMPSAQVARTHYTYNGERSVCGVFIASIPVFPADDEPRPDCQLCLASPTIEPRYRDTEAVKRLRGRGRYDRKQYGLTNEHETH